MVKLALGLLAATFLGTCVVLLSTGPVAEAQFTPQPRPPAWEYRVVSLAGFSGEFVDYDLLAAAVEKKYNELGAEGWELSLQEEAVAVFKRTKPE